MEIPDPRDPANDVLLQQLDTAIRRAMRNKDPEPPAHRSRTLHHLNPEVAAAMIYLRAHPRSAELIRYNAGRGMSRPAMDRIWGQRLVNAVLDHMEIRS